MFSIFSILIHFFPPSSFLHFFQLFNYPFLSLSTIFSSVFFPYPLYPSHILFNLHPCSYSLIFPFIPPSICFCIPPISTSLQSAFVSFLFQPPMLHYLPFLNVFSLLGLTPFMHHESACLIYVCTNLFSSSPLLNPYSSSSLNTTVLLIKFAHNHDQITSLSYIQKGKKHITNKTSFFSGITRESSLCISNIYLVTFYLLG